MPTKLTSKQAEKLIDAAQHAITFEVKGHGNFPIDMLRYDRCWPATDIDASIISRRSSSDIVTLQGLKLPTVARWASFGWTVVA